MTTVTGRAHDVALGIAALLEDTVNVGADVVAPHNVMTLRTGEKVRYWKPATLGTGHAGIALFFGELSHRYPEWLPAARQHLKEATWSVTEIADVPGLIDGLAGLGFAARAVACSPHDCRELLLTCNERIEQLVCQRIALLHENIDVLCYVDYDVIGGLAGVLGYLLRLDEPRPQMVESIVDILVSIAAPRLVDGVEVPGWWGFRNPGFGPVSAALGEKAFDVGMAHGAAGILAALASARSADVVHDRLTASLNYLADWLLASGHPSGAIGLEWPSCLSFTEQTEGLTEPPEDRGAWCYGAPGVAAALFAAGRASGRDDLVSHAIAAMERVVASFPLASVGRVGLCHGLGGLTKIAAVLGSDGRSPALRDFADEAVGRICDLYSVVHRFGFDNEGGAAGALPDDPSLLGGAAGVGLLLLSYADGVSATEWESALMIK